MKRRMVGVLAVVVAILGLLPSTAPVAAGPAKGPDNKPVAWVSAATNTANSIDGFHGGMYASVKLLADGSTVGNVVTHDYVKGVTYLGMAFDQDETVFYEDPATGVRTAAFVVRLHNQQTGAEFWSKFSFIDGGEPSEDVDFNQQFISRSEFPLLPPPPAGGADPNWFSMYGPPRHIVTGNVQIHFTQGDAP